MSSSLSRIPPAKRRQLAATLGLFAVLFVAVAAVAATGPSTGALRAFVVIALVVAVALALMGWGVLHSVRADLAQASLDAAIAEAVAARGGSLCDCGHEHDPTELHLVGDEHGQSTDDPCAQDGLGHDCTHTCETCVLATLRSVPARPSPRPRPRPTPAGHR